MPAFERAKAFMLHRHRLYSSHHGQVGNAASFEHDIEDDSGIEDDDGSSVGSRVREERHERPGLVLPRLTSPPERGSVHQASRGVLTGFHSPPHARQQQQQRGHPLRGLQRLREQDEGAAARRWAGEGGGGGGSPLMGRYRTDTLGMREHNHRTEGAAQLLRLLFMLTRRSRPTGRLGPSILLKSPCSGGCVHDGSSVPFCAGPKGY
jgi:hypothetical protein